MSAEASGAEADIRAYLERRGYAAEADAVIEEARRFPSWYAYTVDRYAWAVKHMPAGTWSAGDSTETERRITALRTARVNNWRLVP